MKARKGRKKGANTRKLSPAWDCETGSLPRESGTHLIRQPLLRRTCHLGRHHIFPTAHRWWYSFTRFHRHYLAAQRRKTCAWKSWQVYFLLWKPSSRNYLRRSLGRRWIRLGTVFKLSHLQKSGFLPSKLHQHQQTGWGTQGVVKACIVPWWHGPPSLLWLGIGSTTGDLWYQPIDERFCTTQQAVITRVGIANQHKPWKPYRNCSNHTSEPSVP